MADQLRLKNQKSKLLNNVSISGIWEIQAFNVVNVLFFGISMKHKLIHSGVDWKKVYKAQSKKWASRSGPVVIVKKAKDKDTNQ